ncbi:MAG: HIT family protein [Candidatus Chromulinivorax sp.]
MNKITKNIFIFTGIIVGFVSIIAIKDNNDTQEVKHLVNRLNKEFEQWETINPQQGYCITITTKGKHRLEGKITPYGEKRTTLTLSGIPTDKTNYIQNCPFCVYAKKNQTDKKIAKDFGDGTCAITSLNDQILIIPTEHYDHFFATPFDIQVKIIKNALALRNAENTILKRPLEFHCGAAAEQTVFHLHARTGIYVA